MNATCRVAVWLSGAVCLGLLISPAQGAEPNVLGFSPEAMERGGKLVIVGGGDAPDEIYDEFMRLAGGRKARIVLIPSAFPYESRDEIEERFLGWKTYRMAGFDILDAATRDEADDADFVQPLEKATGVWISGGDQTRLAELYNGTRMEQALRRVLDRGGVVGGTSAGASFMSHKMIHYTDEKVQSAFGLGLVQRAIIDQHFTQRGRHTRLLGVLDDHPELIGLGVDENTALIVHGNHLRVIGESKVTIFLTPDEDEAVKIYRLKHDEEAKLTTIESDNEFNTPRIELRKIKR